MQKSFFLIQKVAILVFIKSLYVKLGLSNCSNSKNTNLKYFKDSNQMIRASALRVLSSIRVSIIVPIMLIAIKEGVTDMCPFVRKTAAHAIPKLYR